MHQLKVKILDPRIGTEFELPERATEGSAAVDLRACISAPYTLAPQETLRVPTGIAIHIEDPNLVGIIAPRSGISVKRHLIPANLVGVIDSDYQGELIVALFNRSNEPQEIVPGERIAQLLLLPCIPFDLEITGEFKPSDRGNSGFGSTGRY